MEPQGRWVADALGEQDNLQLLIILPYIISIYNVQIHCEHFRGLQALSWCFLITVNSPTEVGRIFEHFFKVSCQNSPETSPFSEGIMQKSENWYFFDHRIWGCSV